MKRLKLIRTRRYPRVVVRDYKEVELTPAQERDEALSALLNIVNAWRAVNRYRVAQPQTVAERMMRQEALEAVLEEGRRHLEAVQWL